MGKQETLGTVLGVPQELREQQKPEYSVALRCDTSW